MRNVLSLKIKRNTLAWESKHIRKHERNAYKHFRSNLDYTYKHNQQKTPDTDKWSDSITESLWAYQKLREHRTLTVRPVARHTNIAIAFIRGKEYIQVEHSRAREFDTRVVAKMVMKYRPKGGVTLDNQIEEIKKWVEQGR